MFRRIGGATLRHVSRRPAPRCRLCDRKFSAQSAATIPTASTPSPLGGVIVELDRIAPRFEIPASDISILESPADFYSTLKVRGWQKIVPVCAKSIA